jgi:uncharacterized membrane-anchored protein
MLRTVFPLTLCLCTLGIASAVTLAPIADARASERKPEQREPAAEAAAEPEPDAALSPEQERMAAKIDAMSPAAQALFEAIDDDGIDALIDRANAGEPLDAAERELFDTLLSYQVDEFERQLSYQTGDVSLRGELATAHLGDEFKFLGPEDARKVVVDAWGNPPSVTTNLVGMIVPTEASVIGPDGWGIVVSYTEDGHIEDEDAEDIDYDELMEDMKEGDKADNEARRAEGYGEAWLVGWAEPPHYDNDVRGLYWATELDPRNGGPHGLNYAVRLLGRKGVLELNAISSMDQLQAIKAPMETLLARVEFERGNRYEDFDPDIDEVAAYGIGGLIAGKLAMKAGLFAGLLKFLVAGKKFIIIGVIALGAAIKGVFFGRNKSE